jgi:hypothetical protein
VGRGRGEQFQFPEKDGDGWGMKEMTGGPWVAVREREGAAGCSLGWSAGPLAQGRPSWAGVSFFCSTSFTYFLFS